MFLFIVDCHLVSVCLPVFIVYCYLFLIIWWIPLLFNILKANNNNNNKFTWPKLYEIFSGFSGFFAGLAGRTL